MNLQPLSVRNYTYIVEILAKPVSCDLFTGYQLGLHEKLENMSPHVINHTYSPVNYPYSPVVLRGLFKVGEKCEKLI